MCDDSYAERLYWMHKMEQLRKQTELEEQERLRKAAGVPAKPVKPTAGAEQPDPVPV